MWNQKASNRLLDLKWKRENQLKHLRTLQNIKAQVNTSAPKTYSFLYSRPKARQLQQERNSQIDTHNVMLVNHMLNISSTISSKDQVFFKQSLNSAYRTRNERLIDDGNQKLVRKLQRATSAYSQRGLQKHLSCYYKARTNMASEKMDPYYDLETLDQLARNPAPLHKSRPFSAKH